MACFIAVLAMFCREINVNHIFFLSLFQIGLKYSLGCLEMNDILANHKSVKWVQCGKKLAIT